MAKKSHTQAQQEKSAAVKSRHVYSGRIFSLRIDTYRLDGQEKEWDIIVHPGAVVVLAVNDRGEILFVEQWRRAAQQVMIELPAGALEKNESPLLCAQRELQEETGFRAKDLTALGGFFTVPGFCTEYLHLFLAKNLEPAPLPGDDGEEIDLLPLSLDKVHQLIDNGGICDAKTIAGVYRYERWLKFRS
jgi:ADP-ribose pyrophosphatase